MEEKLHMQRGAQGKRFSLDLAPAAPNTRFSLTHQADDDLVNGEDGAASSPIGCTIDERIQ